VIVGLGLVVSTESGVLLVSGVYPSNLADLAQLPASVVELVAGFEILVGDKAIQGRLSLVYDARQSPEDNYELVEGSASLDRSEGLRDDKVRLWSRTLPLLLWPLTRGYGKAVLGLPRPLRRPSASSQSSTPVLDGAGSASQGEGRSRGCHHLGPGSVPPGRGGPLLEEQATELCHRREGPRRLGGGAARKGILFSDKSV
jgi:hypothetical protein